MKNVIISKFKYNNCNYVIYLKNSNTISYGYMDGKNIKTDLTDEEIKLMDFVASKSIISNDPNNYEDLGDFEYNNKKYQIFLDSVSGLRFFREWKNGKLVKPHYKEIAEFMYYLNTSKLLVKLKEPLFDSEKSKKFKRIIKTIEIGFLSIEISIALYLTAYVVAPRVLNDINLEYYNSPTSISTKNEEDIITYEDIINALDQNPNLSEQEKKFIIKQSFSLLKNTKYVNKKLVVELLKKVYFKYNDYTNSECLGSISQVTGQIDIYECTSFEDCDEETLAHEVQHIFEANKCLESFGRWLSEGLNSTVNAEQNGFKFEECSYYAQQNFAKILMEIIGGDAVKSFYYYGDINYILVPLNEIIPDKSLSKRLINIIDLYMPLYGQYYTPNNVNQDDLNIKDLYKLEEEALKIIRQYYETKYNRPLEDDFLMRYYVSKVCNLLPIDVTYTDQNGNKITDYKVMKNYFIITESDDVLYTTGAISYYSEEATKVSAIYVENIDQIPLKEFEQKMYDTVVSYDGKAVKYVKKEYENIKNFQILVDQNTEPILTEDGDYIIIAIVWNKEESRMEGSVFAPLTDENRFSESNGLTK